MLTRNKEIIQKIKETIYSIYIYQNELDKACNQHDMAYDKILRDNAINLAKHPKYDGYQRGLASMVYKFFDKILLLRVQINLLAALLKMRIFQTMS